MNDNVTEVIKEYILTIRKLKEKSFSWKVHRYFFKNCKHCKADDEMIRKLTSNTPKQNQPLKEENNRLA